MYIQKGVFMYLECVSCPKLGITCKGPNFVAMPAHDLWEWCKKRFSDSRKGLWIRNNGSTMISQLLNTSLFTFIAFYGVHPLSTLISIFASSYAIFIVTSLIDTPIVYWCRNMREKGNDGLKSL